MDENAEHRNLVLDFIRAFEMGDLSTIDRLLAPNFRDWRKTYGEMSRNEFLRTLEILFAARQSCAVNVTSALSEGDAVAAEMNIHIDVDGEHLDMALHNLFFVEDGLITALREYGDDAG